MAVQVVLVAGVVEAAIEQKNIYIETLLRVVIMEAYTSNSNQKLIKKQKFAVCS